MSNRTWASKLRRILLTGGIALAAAIAPVIAAPVSAQAASVVGFQPGNIISDELFYNGNAMNAGEIQTFLNQRLASCRIGTAPYMPGWPSPSGSGNIIANNCLKDFRQTTSSQLSDRYCNGYSGAVNESAAQIIAKVGQSCGISQKVLLVMLEKEQSLLTDSWPVTRQYNYALGMNCPDSGPGNTANCDAASAGFSLQLYLGARQLKVYKGNPNSFNYKPFQVNRIQWHPNVACGTSDVYIENWATAALYIYTPYRPNAAALNAGWGTGDGCSSYGNRNFFLFYSNWFGMQQTFEVYPALKPFHEENGGAAGLFGVPVGAASVMGNGSIAQPFAGGYLYWHPVVGFGAVNGGIRDMYLAEGGHTGYLGFPIGTEIRANGVSRQEFQGGTAYWTNATGVSVINGAIRTLYYQEGGPGGYLGYPVGAEVRANGASRQEFQGGTAYWTNATGASVINGAIRGLYLAEGGPAGYLGYPIGVEERANGASRQEFQGGTAFWTNATGVSVINGAIRTLYFEEGGPSSYLGYPIGPEVRANGASRQEFQGGTAYWTNATGASVINGAIRGLYLAEGGPAGYLGYPIGPEKRENGVSRQEFQAGTAFWSAGTGAAIINGAIRTAYLASGGSAGNLGLPIGPEVRSYGQSVQLFQNGKMVWTPSGGVNTILNP